MKLAPMVALLAALALSAASASAEPAGVSAAQPFKYSFRIAKLDVTATLTYGQSKVVSRGRLDAPSNERLLSWLGPKPTLRARPRTIAVAALNLVGKADYSSPDTSCSSTLPYRSSPTHPVKASLHLDSVTWREPRIRVDLSKFPLGAPTGGKDAGTQDTYPNKCGKAEVGWWDTAEGVVPLSVLSRPSFTFTAHRKERFEDPGIESIDWTVAMTVKRVKYHAINCATEPGC